VARGSPQETGALVFALMVGYNEREMPEGNLPPVFGYIPAVGGLRRFSFPNAQIADYSYDSPHGLCKLPTIRYSESDAVSMHGSGC
jgi:hypothetical protein